MVPRKMSFKADPARTLVLSFSTRFQQGRVGRFFSFFMQGYFYIHRKIAESWVWSDKPFSFGQAWIDMIRRANHKKAEILFSGKIVTIERGSFLTSQEKLKKDWGWKRKRFDCFVKNLKKSEMILVENWANQGTYVTICNYSAYQNEGQTKVQTRSKRGANGGAINNNVNNEKQCKHGAEPPSGKKEKEVIKSALLALFPHIQVETQADHSNLGGVVKALHEKGATSERIKKIYRTYVDEWPEIDCTPRALLNNWDLLKKKFEEKVSI